MNRRRLFLELGSLAGIVALMSSRVAMGSTTGINRCVSNDRRTIALNVETTGLDLGRGHRIIEIAAIEIMERKITGHCFHTYCDPERALNPVASLITGLNHQFLTDKPRFCEIVDKLMQFIGDAPLLVHNPPFAFSFLDAELERLGRDPIFGTWPHATDTLQMAHAAGLNRGNLAYLCKHFGIPFGQESVTNRLKVVRTIGLIYQALPALMRAVGVT